LTLSIQAAPVDNADLDNIGLGPAPHAPGDRTMQFNRSRQALRGFVTLRSRCCQGLPLRLRPGLERLEDRTLWSLVLAGSDPVGQSPVALVVGDFNGDGKADIVTANRDSNSVSILLGNGDGTFRSALTIPVDSSPQKLATGDFNGDGKLDLAVATGSGNIDVLLGNGDGTFRKAPPIALGYGVFSVVAGDFNGDGKLDLAAVSLSRTFVTILAGKGDGTFAQAGTLPLASGAASITAADFNGDGKLDLAVINEGDINGNGAHVSIFLGNGNGTFVTGANYPAGKFPAAIAVADLNGDHKLDLAVADFVGGAVDVLLGNGDGTFQSAAPFAAGRDPHDVAAGDFNNDGVPDLAVSNFNSGSISVLLGTGHGAFRGPVTISLGGPLSSSPGPLAVGDFNGDGKQDLAVGDGFGNVVRILLNQAQSGPEAIVNQFYLDLLQRPAEPAGLAFWTGLLNQGVAPSQIVLGIEQSLEFRTDEINKVYEQLLGRLVDPSGLQTGLYVLATFGLEAELAFVASSPEFFEQAGGTIDGWLTAIYRDALNRIADPSGRSAFEQELNGGVINLRQAADIIFKSPEYQQDVVQSYYTTFLRRSPDPSGAAFWLSELQSGVSPEQVIAGIVGSTEYFNLAQALTT
jgi:hypothetical protein